MSQLPTVTLNACPVGLFLTPNGELCVVTEYATQADGGPVQRDAYVVRTGEYFWGGAKTTEQRGRVPVTPLAIDGVAADFWRAYAYDPNDDE